VPHAGTNPCLQGFSMSQRTPVSLTAHMYALPPTSSPSHHLLTSTKTCSGGSVPSNTISVQSIRPMVLIKGRPSENHFAALLANGVRMVTGATTGYSLLGSLECHWPWRTFQPLTGPR
jgi:hypothetical protein